MRVQKSGVTAALAITAVCVFLSGASAQQWKVDSVFDALSSVHEFQQVAISPDGKSVAWVEASRSEGGSPTANAAIYVAEVATPQSRPQRITAGQGEPAEEHGIAWSPDSRHLAFLSNAQTPAQSQLYVADANGGGVRKLTNLTGALDEPGWSPDGKSVALLFIENAPRVPGPMEPMTPPAGVIGAKIFEQRLAVVGVASGDVRQLTPPDMYVYEYDWSPGSDRFVVTAAHGAGDGQWYVAGLYTVAAASGDTKLLYKPKGQFAIPRWSPDGKQVAFIGGLMSDEGSIGGDIFVLPASGGDPRNLTPNIKASPSWLSWLPGGEDILLLENLDGSSAIASLRVSTGVVSQVWRGADTLSLGGAGYALSLAADGKTSAAVRQSFDAPPEVWAGSLGSWKEITEANRQARPSWGKTESIHWSNGGFQVQGWLTYPRDYNPSQRYPMVVSVHGGPSVMARPSWPGTFFSLTVLSEDGYFVFEPNPRGSYGNGEAFTRANVKDFGYGDLQDILAGVDHIVKTLPVDNDRVGIGGWSYGGFMTMWAVTRTHRFRAAVAGAGIMNWQSYYGENDIDEWLIPFFGASVYDDPAVYAKSSPITFIKNAKTPTLILVGDRDGECPVPQSFEFWHALEDLKVENQFVVYPGEGHTLHTPEHRRDVLQRTADWFDQRLK